MPKPLIGITTYNDKDSDGNPLTGLNHSYLNAIAQAGGVPIPFPSMFSKEDCLDLYSRLDGILFSGGGDVSLEYFNGSDHPKIGAADKGRDSTEITLLCVAVNDGKPILGICRGAQVMNVALGGTLYTHIQDQLQGALDHDNAGDLRRVLAHPVNVDEGTRSARIFGETRLNVNSLHHQGLKDIAVGLRAAGHAPDGLVEVVEIPNHPYAFAVQWHPEWLMDQLCMQRLFKSFVDAAGR